MTLYRTPEKIFITDITTSTRVNQDLSAQFSYNVSYFLENEEKENIKCVIQLLGKEEIIVVRIVSSPPSQTGQGMMRWWLSGSPARPARP